MKTLIAVAFLLFSPVTLAGEYHLTTHSASYAGMLALGGGWTSTGGGLLTLGLEALVGYVPRTLSHEDVWSGVIRSRAGIGSVAFDSTVWTPAYLGIFALFAFDDDTFIILPKRYPKKYYPPTGLYWGLTAGSELRWNSSAIYVEIATLDAYLEYKLNNWTEIRWQDVISLGAGLRWYLGP